MVKYFLSRESFNLSTYLIMNYLPAQTAHLSVLTCSPSESPLYQSDLRKLIILLNCPQVDIYLIGGAIGSCYTDGCVTYYYNEVFIRLRIQESSEFSFTYGDYETKKVLHKHFLDMWSNILLCGCCEGEINESHCGLLSALRFWLHILRLQHPWELPWHSALLPAGVPGWKVEELPVLWGGRRRAKTSSLHSEPAGFTWGQRSEVRLQKWWGPFPWEWSQNL